MKINSIKEKFFYVVAIGLSIFLLFFVIACSWIGYDVKSQCHEAQGEYGGDCVESLISLLNDEGKGFGARNRAIWALGQLGDARALPVLESYYTGNIPPREPLDESISQYELKKAINLASGGFNIVAWTWRRGFFDADKNTNREVIKETIVVSQQSDPYYGLAQKISQEENLEIVDGFADVLRFNPRFIILVASPDNLTAERLASIGYVFKNQDYYPALGIISGSTLEKAEQLWARRDLAKEGNNYVGGDTEVPQLVYEPTIFNISDGANEKIALNKNSLLETLEQADYFYWTRHSGATTWFWNEGSENWGENDELFSKDIPQLKPVVIYSPTCTDFRPWVKDSIALGFVDQGAAAYLGFVNSPHTIAFLKRGLSAPGITSWKEFPLGVVAQIGNKAATKTVFNSPQFFMLGDPRIYLSKDQPYQIVSDTVVENGKRVIEGETGVNGVLAVKIVGGSEYSFLTIKGLTSASESDLFYNSKLQTLNLGGDKYVSFLHDGGRFEIELSRQVPFLWRATDALTDAFDYSWVVLWLDVYEDANPYIYVISLPVFIAILLITVLRQKRTIRDFQKIFLVAFLFALLRLAYFLLRVDDYSVSANLVGSTPLKVAIGCIGVFATTAGGLMLMKYSRKKIVKALGLVFAVSRQFWLTGFRLGFITLLSSVPEVTKMTRAWVWNYNAFWLPFIVLLFEIAVILVLYRIVSSDKEVTSVITRAPDRI